MKTMGVKQKDFMDSLLLMDAKCELRVVVWYPKEKQLNWLLNFGGFKVSIHPSIATILNIYNGPSSASSPIELSVFCNDPEEAVLRKHPKLEGAYEEYDRNRQEKEVNKQNGKD